MGYFTWCFYRWIYHKYDEIKAYFLKNRDKYLTTKHSTEVTELASEYGDPEILSILDDLDFIFDGECIRRALLANKIDNLKFLMDHCINIAYVIEQKDVCSQPWKSLEFLFTKGFLCTDDACEYVILH